MKLTPLGCACLGLGLIATAASAQIATNCTPTKNQVVLRQRVAELDAAEGRLNAGTLRAEVDAMRRQGKMTDAQAEEFERIIRDSQAPRGPLDTPEGAALARSAMDEKVQELEVAKVEPIPEADPAVHAAAQAALAAKSAELQLAQATPPPPTQTDDSARQAEAAKAALDAKMRELSAASPVAEPADSDAAVQARAQAALAEKMAELERQAAAPTPPPVTDQRTPAQRALDEKMAELERQSQAPTGEAPTKPQPAPQPTPQPAPTVVPRVEAQPPTAPVVVTPAPVVVRSPEPVAVAPAPTQPVPNASAIAQDALNAAMTDLNRQENVSITGVPVQPVPLTPQQQVEAQSLLRHTETAPAAAAAAEAPPKTGLERLNELTDLYRTHQLTPAEYHRERAQIIKTLTP